MGGSRMTADRELRERVIELRDRIRRISTTTCLTDIAELFAQVADDLDAALTASEEPRCSCGQDAATEAEFLEPRHPDADCPFHGIEASEGGSATPEQEVRGSGHGRSSWRTYTGPLTTCAATGGSRTPKATTRR